MRRPRRSAVRAAPEPRRGDAGYALLAAITAVAVFAYMAFQVLAAGQGAQAIATGRFDQARLRAAADAGLALALHGLLADDRGARWTPDGRVRHVDFAGYDLAITVEDERGKAPITSLDARQARALFAGAGAAGEQLDNLVGEFIAWQTDPAAGSEELDSLATPPPADGRPIRHGPFKTVGELAALRDMTPILFDRIAPAVTVFFEETGTFDAGHAKPLAKAAMSANDFETSEQIAAEEETANQRPEEELADAASLVGDPLTISVVAAGPDGGRARRMEIVELTGDPREPFWIRYTE